MNEAACTKDAIVAAARGGQPGGEVLAFILNSQYRIRPETIDLRRDLCEPEHT